MTWKLSGQWVIWLVKEYNSVLPWPYEISPMADTVKVCLYLPNPTNNWTEIGENTLDRKPGQKVVNNSECNSWFVLIRLLSLMKSKECLWGKCCSVCEANVVGCSWVYFLTTSPRNFTTTRLPRIVRKNFLASHFRGVCPPCRGIVVIQNVHNDRSQS